jgi:hypothetical protein
LRDDEDGFEHHLRLAKKLETEPDFITLHNAPKLNSALSGIGSASCLALKDRIELAAALVQAVLQHHTLPWLPDTWTSQDVYFLQGPEGFSRETFIKPYFRAPRSPTLTDQWQTPRLPLISNATLFNLAIVLIEISYKAPLEDLLNEDEKRDFENPIGKLWAIPTAASRLVLRVQDHVVIPSYEEVARRCLHGDFSQFEFHEKDLSNDAFLTAVYANTVKPLENDLLNLGCRKR